jgi:SSS family solute:Na+ symporter
MSLLVKFGALVFIIFLPTKYAIDLQLLGGVWILQIFPAVVFTLYAKRKPMTIPYLAGWLAGMASGTTLAIAQGLKPTIGIGAGQFEVQVYIGLVALAINIFVFGVASIAVRSTSPEFPAGTRS